MNSTFAQWLETQTGAGGTLGAVATAWKASKGSRPRVSGIEKVTNYVVSVMVEQGADQAQVTQAMYELAERYRAVETGQRGVVAPEQSVISPALAAAVGRIEQRLADIWAVVQPLGELLAAVAEQTPDLHERTESEVKGWLGDDALVVTGSDAASVQPDQPAAPAFYGSVAPDPAAQRAFWDGIADAAGSAGEAQAG